MNELRAILDPGFILHHALYGSLATGLVCPLVGVYFLLRRLVFWGVALPQASAAGIAFALMLQGFGVGLLAGAHGHEEHLAIAASMAFTLTTILVLAALERRGLGASEGRIGVLYALAAACAILFVNWNPTGETELLSLLKGEIVTISETDFHAMLNALAAVTACILLFQREFLLVSFDRDMAVTLGRKVLFWDSLLFLLVGVTISLGVMTVGPLVIFGMLLLPPMAALPWAGGMLSFSLLASAFGGVSAFAGFYASYAYDLPLGPVIVCAAGALLGLSEAARLLVRPR